VLQRSERGAKLIEVFSERLAFGEVYVDDFERNVITALYVQGFVNVGNSATADKFADLVAAANHTPDVVVAHAALFCV
jgi:hypothetical protein